MRRAVYRGPPRNDDEKKFFDAMAGLLRVQKDELEEREKRWKADRAARKRRPPPKSGGKVAPSDPVPDGS